MRAWRRCVFPAHPLMAELVQEPLVVDRTGHIELSDRPGLGVHARPEGRRENTMCRLDGAYAMRAGVDGNRGRGG